MTEKSVTLRDPQQIRVLASPVRQEIVDTLRALRVASIGEIAAELGRPADGLYYHVRRLVAAGLLVAAGHRGEAREREALYSLPGRAGQMSLHYDPDDAENVAAVTAVAGGLLRVAQRDFERGMRSQEAVCEGPGRNLWVFRGTGWLDDQELAEVHALLERVNELLARRRKGHGRKLHAVACVLTPVRTTRRGF